MTIRCCEMMLYNKNALYFRVILKNLRGKEAMNRKSFIVKIRKFF